MSSPVPTAHINAKIGDFAQTVLMPGDPLRSKFIADTFLERAVLVNNVRGVQGYTGYYKGKRVSVMASGMGQPSIGIYSHELFNFFGVDKIIRVGSCGGYNKDVHVRDIILAQGACSNSNFTRQFDLPGTFCPIADFEMLTHAVQACVEKGLKYHVGNLLSSDIFYEEESSFPKWAKMGVLGVEMETATLYTTAARASKKALTICTVSDSLLYPEEDTTAEERQNSFTDMMEIALEIA